jgi:hypothetical protein
MQRLNMWLDPWLINIYESKIYGHICDVVTFIKFRSMGRSVVS